MIVENQFMQKADDVRRKAQMRGGGRIKHVRQIEDVLTAERINVDSARKRFESCLIIIFHESFNFQIN